MAFCSAELNNLVLESEVLPSIDEPVHSVDCVLLTPEPVVQAGFLEFLRASAVLIHALNVNLVTSLHFNFPFRPLACFGVGRFGRRSGLLHWLLDGHGLPLGVDRRGIEILLADPTEAAVHFVDIAVSVGFEDALIADDLLCKFFGDGFHVIFPFCPRYLRGGKLGGVTALYCSTLCQRVAAICFVFVHLDNGIYKYTAVTIKCCVITCTNYTFVSINLIIQTH